MKDFLIPTTDAEFKYNLEVLRAAGYKIYYATDAAQDMGEYSYLALQCGDICRAKGHPSLDRITLGDAVDRIVLHNSRSKIKAEIEAEISALQEKIEELKNKLNTLNK